MVLDDSSIGPSVFIYDKNQGHRDYLLMGRRSSYLAEIRLRFGVPAQGYILRCLGMERHLPYRQLLVSLRDYQSVSLGVWKSTRGCEAEMNNKFTRMYVWYNKHVHSHLVLLLKRSSVSSSTPSCIFKIIFGCACGWMSDDRLSNKVIRN